MQQRRSQEPTLQWQRSREAEKQGDRHMNTDTQQRDSLCKDAVLLWSVAKRENLNGEGIGAKEDIICVCGTVGGNNSVCAVEECNLLFQRLVFKRGQVNLSGGRGTRRKRGAGGWC